MADTHGSESQISKIPLRTEKLAPVLEGVGDDGREDGPAWEKKSFSRFTERTGVEVEVEQEDQDQDQDRLSDLSAVGPLSITLVSNSKPDLLAFDHDTEQASASNEAGGCLTNEIKSANEMKSVGKRGGISETYCMEQSAHGGLRSPTAEGGDVVDVPSPRTSVDQNDATSFLGGVPRQRELDAECSGLSTECRRSDSPENATTALLLAEGQTRGAQDSVVRAKSCTTQLGDSQKGGREERTSQPNALSTTEQVSQGENIAEFHALLREAIQQSDAELAAEKESACTFKRQLSLPALAEHSPPRQCGSPREALQPVTSSTTSNIAEDCCPKDCGSDGNDRVSSAAYMDGPSSLSAPPTPLSETPQGQWVRYISPEGHPYLYNEVTGSSRWADPSEEEVLQVHTAVDAAVVEIDFDTAVDAAVVGTAVDTGKGATNKMRVTERADANDEDKGADDTGSIGVDGEGREGREGREQVVEEGGSACTFEASQTSQDTSDPDARNSAGETAMHLAAAQHSVRGLRLLLTGGAHVNATDEQGRTPLHVACESCRKNTNDRGSDQSRECVELLLSRGAMEDARDAMGQTPLHISALAGNLGAAQALIVAGATASADAAGNSPLHLAAAQGHSEIIQLLVLGNRGCDTGKPSSAADEEVSSPKLAHDEGPGSCAATELATEGTDASGSVSEARYPPADRTPRADDQHPLDRAVADGGPALQTPDNFYQHNATGTSRRKQQRGMSGAERRAQSGARTGVEDLPTTFGADIPTNFKRPQNLPPSHSVSSAVAAAGVALGDRSPSCGGVAISYPDSRYLARNTEAMQEETEAVEYQRGFREDRRERRSPVEIRETRYAPTVGVSARAKAKESRRSWDRGSRNHSLPRRRHDQLGREFDHSEVGRSGLDELDKLDKLGVREEGDEGDGRQSFLDYNHVQQRPEGRGGKASSRPRRRQGSDRDDQAVPWPEALPPDIYEQTVGAVLATRGDDSGMPPYSALIEALFAACVASRLDDAAAVLRLLELQGRETAYILDEGGRTPLHHACRGDDVSLVRLLCQARADPDARDFQGNSPLVVAAATGSTSCVRFLLQGGIDPHGCNDVGDTPLHVAAWHGNLSCVKALVGGGARLNQLNRSGLTAREALLNAGPTFSRGRPPKVVRATLKYMECAEASAPHPKLPTKASQDDYDSDFTAVTAASRTSPERSNDIDNSGLKTDTSRRQGVYNSEAVRGASSSSGCPGGTRTPTAPGDREREGERNWERWKQREERSDRGRRTEGDEVFRRAKRRDSNTQDCFARNGNFSGAEQTQLHDPYGSYGGEYAANSALNNDGSLAPHFEPLRERYNPGYSEAGGDFSTNQAAAQVDYGVGEYDTHRRYERRSERDETPEASFDSHGSRHRREEQEATPNASTPSRARGGVWSVVGRAFDYMIGGGDSRDERDGVGSNEESDDCAPDKPPSNHPPWRPPTDSELREGAARIAPLSPSKPMPREGPSRATCADTMGDSRQVDTTLETESHDTKVPLSLTPMQPPPDVLAAMKGRMAAGQRQQFSAPPADVAAAIGNAAEERQRDYAL